MKNKTEQEDIILPSRTRPSEKQLSQFIKENLEAETFTGLALKQYAKQEVEVCKKEIEEQIRLEPNRDAGD